MIDVYAIFSAATMMQILTARKGFTGQYPRDPMGKSRFPFAPKPPVTVTIDIPSKDNASLILATL